MSDEQFPALERWRQIDEICWKVLERPIAERAAMLDEACAGDPGLRREAESLLAGHPAASDFLETSALDVAADLLAQGAEAGIAGRRVGPYVVMEWLGSGGMGDVYRGRDQTLRRDVALKILPALFADDADRMARFTREAQVLASINHPNIAAIYGFEESNGLRALILEFVEGPTLGDLLADGPLSVEDAVSIARQIAEGLEAAHECGIVHRDLKPSNVVVRPDGTVKVLDFGLATALPLGPAPGVTEAAATMGTPAYGSPEQVKGRLTDRRADIWAFGAVLYEMLSGRRAFTGESTSDIAMSVLHQDVDWMAVPASTPAPLRRLLARCLERDARQRLRDIGEARIVLEDPASAIAADTLNGGAAAVPSAHRSGRRLWPALAAGAIVLAAGAVWLVRSAATTPPAVMRFTHTLPEGQSITLPASRHMVGVSPDGAHMVYVVSSGLQLRTMSNLEVRTIRGSEAFGAITTPVFSPDGTAIAFWTPVDRTIKRIPVAGGEAVTIAIADDPYGMSWAGDSIVFGQGSGGIMRVRADGGTPELLVRVSRGEEAHGPQLLAGGQHVLFTLATGTSVDRWDTAKVVVQSLVSGQRKVIVDGGSDARYVPTGHLLYARGGTGFAAGTIFAAAFDAARLDVAGTSAPLVEAVRASNGRMSGAYQFDVSSGGTLVYIPASQVGPEWGRQQLVIADRSGKFEPLPLEPGPYGAMRVSPDGARVALEANNADGVNVYIHDLGGATSLQRLTFGGRNRFPVWSADGRHIAFQSDRDGDAAIFSQAADGTGTAARLTKPGARESHAPESWSPDGGTLLFSITTPSEVSLATLSLSDGRVAPFGDVHSSIPTNARFSPDGRWVAYGRADRGMSPTICLEPFPATGAKYQLFVAGPRSAAHKPVWSPDGRELLYVPRLGGFEAVSVTTRPAFAFGHAVPVPRPFSPGAPTVRALYDITPQGRFVGVMPVGDSGSIYSAAQIQVVLNWLEELKRLVPAN
jgi:eukaryotic-like serine/threonine-protein kinase